MTRSVIDAALAAANPCLSAPALRCHCMTQRPKWSSGLPRFPFRVPPVRRLRRAVNVSRLCSSSSSLRSRPRSRYCPPARAAAVPRRRSRPR